MMLLRFVLFTLLLIPLSANDKLSFTLEAGLFVPKIQGTIKNSVANSDFKDDFEYTKTNASYFSMLMELDYHYAPNIYVNYFSLSDNMDTALNKNVHVADGDFNSLVSSSIKYQVLNTILYQDFKMKGKMYTLFGKHLYSGDLEYDIGLNIKSIDWKFNVQDTTSGSPTSPSWIRVKEFIPLPYIGFKYYLYNLMLYANVSALAISKASSTNFSLGVDYRMVKGSYISAGYIYENFNTVEKLDTVKFVTSGYKFSFKYKF